MKRLILWAKNNTSRTWVVDQNIYDRYEVWLFDHTDHTYRMAGHRQLAKAVKAAFAAPAKDMTT